ncbi:uncharacterized protein LOC141680209 [Apium graveolens]|uniref:uncharacterized protein LOC141680209 n=1 Tax=Apium graveolens TaxID=4045 RepID=UPI003D7B44B5
MWNEERNRKSNKSSSPTFSIGCKNGQVELSKERSPPFLYYLLSGGEKTAYFLKNIRTSLKPKEGKSPKFAQLYVYDTENEIQNRTDVVPGSDGLDPEIVEGLLKILYENNKLYEGFRYARDHLNISDTDDFSLILVFSKDSSGRKNQVGPSNEVAVLIIGDSEDTCPFRDIVVQTKQKFLKSVYETCKHFMSLQYPLLFPYGDDGFHLNIPLKSKKQNVPVEQYRLDWIRNPQSTIRSDLYRSIRDSLTKGDTNPGNIGKNVILPATHTGSQRYMNQYFKDSLDICCTIGHPSLFLTMTCNTQWPEIKQMMDYLPGVDVAKKPDVIARVFKLKLDQFLDLIKKKNYFGKCNGVMHVIEFQKRGLPHCYMLIWLHPQPQNVQQIDELIYAEIPDKNMDHIGYNVYANTFFDDCGFPVYLRRRTEASVLKKGVHLDNQYVVSYNRDLLLRFHFHINLEVCNSSRSLKYLFKYFLKGHDTATMLLRKKNTKDTPDESTIKAKSMDEIKNFLIGHYICASKAAWRLLGFNIHHHFSSVERLPVHMEDEKSVSF